MEQNSCTKTNQTYVIIKYMKRRFKSVANHYENKLDPHHILYNKFHINI